MPAAARLLTPTFLLLGVITFVYFLAVGALLPTLPRYVEGPLGAGRFAVGLVVGAFGLSSLLLRPWAGRWSDRRGRKLVILIGGAIVATSVAAYAAAATTGVLFALRLVTGAGEALFFVGTAAAVNDLAPDERRGEALSLFSLSLFGGLAVGPVVGERLLEVSGYPAVWYVAGAASALAGLLAVLLPDTRAPGTAEAPSGRLVHPAAVLPGAIILTGLLGQAGFEAFAALYALEIGMSQSRTIFAVYAGVLLLVRSFGRRLPDRLGLRRVASVAIVLSVGGLVLLGSWATVPGLYTGSVVLSLGHALVFPALMSLAVGSVPATERGSLIGTFTAFVDLAFALGSTVLGYVASVAGFDGAFYTAAGLALVGLVLMSRYRPAPRAAPADSAVAAEPHGF